MSTFATIELDNSGHQEVPTDMDPNSNSVYGQNIGQCGGLDELDAISKAAGLSPLSSFIDETDVVESWNLDEDEMEEMGITRPAENWTEIEDGIGTLTALVAELKTRPPDRTFGRYTTEAILWDLNVYLAILKNASTEDQRFRLCVMC